MVEHEKRVSDFKISDFFQGKSCQILPFATPTIRVGTFTGVALYIICIRISLTNTQACGSYTNDADKYYSSMAITLAMRFIKLLKSRKGQGPFDGVMDSIYYSVKTALSTVKRERWKTQRKKMSDLHVSEIQIIPALSNPAGSEEAFKSL